MFSLIAEFVLYFFVWLFKEVVINVIFVFLADAAAGLFRRSKKDRT